MYGTDAQPRAGSVAAELRPMLRPLHEEADVDVPASHAPPAPVSASLAPARASPTRSSAAIRYRRRLPWLLLALTLHGALIGLFLLPSPATSVRTPVAIQAEIMTESRITPAPPPPKLTLTPPRAQIVVPTPFVSIPDPAALAATNRPAQKAAPVIVASKAPPAPAEPISPPKFDAAYLHNPAPDYPLQARRSREQGTVLLRVEVSPQGSALLVAVEQSSGWPALDEAAASAVRRWRFEAARRGRDPVAAWVLVPIEFDLRT